MPPGMAEAVRKRKVVAGAGPPLPLPACNRFSPLDLISPLWNLPDETVQIVFSGHPRICGPSFFRQVFCFKPS